MVDLLAGPWVLAILYVGGANMTHLTILVVETGTS